MTLAAKNEENGEVLLVFVTQEMPADFDFARTQRVSAVYGEVTGYRVPSSALRVVDGQVGVYVRAGSTIRFRTADVRRLCLCRSRECTRYAVRRGRRSGQRCGLQRSCPL